MPETATLLAARLERLVTGARELTAQQNLDQVLQAVADLAVEVIEARYAAIGLLAGDRLRIETFVTAGLDRASRAAIGPIPEGRGILGLVITESRPIRLADLRAHEAAVGFPPNHPAMSSFLGVPVVGRHGVLGNLYMTNKAGGAEFTPQDEHLAVLLAGMAAAAVENARHHEESARLLSDVQTLLRSRERFFAMVNHELRNSLAAVLGWAEMLVRKKDPATIPPAAFEVLESAETSVALINDLLDLSRLDEDRLRPVIQDVDCSGVIRRAISRVTPAATARQVRFEVRDQEGPPTCRTDSHRVEQILVNLLTNAIRHTPEGTTVEIALEKDPRELQLRVADQGHGIAPEMLEHVFDVYYTKAGEEGRGVGLGLPLSRRLARLLGGDLLATNRPEGGAEFTLRLPVA
ncbi:MAG TPA: GAF domain-containing sensor histidine kinase [Gemmatimonadales bacterium]|nr:GAF domain-containing sensor histidine kinase [Gemmatimonadales bacterium]